MSLRHLLILRHAKAMPGTPAGDDRERALTPQGEREARAVGAFLKRENLAPQLVLCSTATRTRQTLEQLEQGLGQTLDVEFSGKIYHATPDQLLALAQVIPNSVERLMIIGHNPTVQQLALNLAGNGGDAKAMDELALHYPTAALAEISCPGESWSSIGCPKCALMRFILPETVEA